MNQSEAKKIALDIAWQMLLPENISLDGYPESDQEKIYAQLRNLSDSLFRRYIKSRPGSKEKAVVMKAVAAANELAQLMEKRGYSNDTI